jgi:hypothetical protein
MMAWADTPPPGTGVAGIYLPGLQRLSWVALVASLVMYFCFSAHLLFLMGIPYDVPQGSFPAKIHPGTYLLLVSWFSGLGARGNPLGTLGRQAAAEPLLSGALACMVGVFVWACLRHGPGGQAFIIDTLCAPCIFAMAVLLQPRFKRRQLLLLLMALMLMNSLIALGEFAVGKRLVPLFPTRGLSEEDYFRSTALLGHPLVHAISVTTLLPIAVLMPWRTWCRVLVLLLLTLSLLTFGSRSSMVGLLLYAGAAALVLVWGTAHGRYGYTQITGSLVAMVAGAAALLGVVASTGRGERIFKNLVWDNSAAVRVRSWDVLNHVHDADLWFGVPITRIDSIALRVGIDPRYEAIENFWLYLLLLLGIVGFALFLLGLGLLVWHLWRVAKTPMRLGLVVYFLLASGANTLASKTVSLLLLAGAVQCAAAIRSSTPVPRSQGARS